ncbi:coiled-coil domain-containing protein [Sphingomicrobium lutaoense]|uniref:Chromosome segregation ATPase n=1 Tax=Sphingomicrobium lutaoense TaxID=515949 RepID=A0A839Z286_9SPHN|nr:hypothetical protein [Sphingomicrobium lutaoense]MBB3763863.1 chromosome segregation ATPase [Sphingomicrobium lutaoense]
MTASRPQPLSPDLPSPADDPDSQQGVEGFDHYQWEEAAETEAPADAGGRAVLSWALALLAIGWTGYASWSAGRALIGAPLTTPAIAQWVAVVAAPLAMLALAWLMFGRTRRREAEKFTRSVISMKAEARALEDQLSSLVRRIDDSRTALAGMTSELDGMASEAAERIAGASQSIAQDTARMAEHGARFDRSAAAARADMETLLSQLPEADQHAASLSEKLQQAGSTASDQTSQLADAIERIAEASAKAEQEVSAASDSLAERLGAIDETSGKAGTMVDEARSKVDDLLAAAAEALGEVRGGIDAQAAAVSALVAQAQAGLANSGSEAAALLGEQIGRAEEKLARFSERVAAQDAATQSMLGDFRHGIDDLDQRFAGLAESGDQRAGAMREALANVREELARIEEAAQEQDNGLLAMSERTTGLHEQVARLAAQVREQLSTALGEADDKAGSLVAVANELTPSIEAMRQEAEQASQRLSESAETIETSHQRLGELMAGVDGGVGMAQRRLDELKAMIAEVGGESEKLTSETGPALVEALLRVREAASHAAERAREAISAAIPQSAGELSEAAREALERAVREGVEEQLRGVDALAARAVEAARGATDKLAAQMLSLGQTAGALEAYMNEIEADERGAQSEEFARRTAYLMESMHSAAIDVEKILSDDVDEKSWAAYLKGERGVFTRKAVKLLSSSEARALGQHYSDDAEFQDAVNRYVQDFEAMLRRVLAERDGDVMAVTLMGSDMGKLYAALSQVVSRRG